MSYIEIYTRCTGDCLFATRFCPRDGWSSDGTQKVFEAKNSLKAAGVVPSTEQIREELAGKVDKDTLDALVEVRFPHERLRVDCFVPFDGYR